MRIRPFHGYRCVVESGPGATPDLAPDLTRVVAPPYDQISADTQARLYAMSPHNVVRITLPREEAGLDGYRAARATLDRWLAQGVWVPEHEPAIYPYQQTYTVAGAPVTRAGFIALGEVTDYAERVVLPHERTHAGPKQDRMRLLEATRADVGLLFMLVSDPDGELLRATAPSGAPLAEARDLRGERHQLWRLTDAGTIGRVQELLAAQPVIIADGHHRYETAVEYARRHGGAGYKLMAFCTLEAPGLTIFPNHRLVRGVNGFSLDGLVRGAAPWFDAAPLADPERFRPSNRTIGAVAGPQARDAPDAVILRLRDEAFARIAWPDGTSRAWRELAVSILHEGLLRPLLDITDAKLEAKTHVDYTADQAEAVRLARAGRCQAAFLLAPTTPAELLAVVREGALLPQKSTHFYPKLLDGLVFHRVGTATERD